MYYIGVAGQKRNGKDTIADYLLGRLNGLAELSSRKQQSWTRGAFAGGVKDIFCDSFEKDMEYVEKWKVIPEAPPDLDMPVRQALQFIGDGFRQIKGSIWIDQFFRKYTGPTIVSDVRYINEMRAIRAKNGINIVVVHPERINDDPNRSEAEIRPFAEYVLEMQHGRSKAPAEMHLLNYYIINNGSVDDLYRKVESLVPEIWGHFDNL